MSILTFAGIKGIAPILVATLDGEGNFIEGKIHSTIQLRPDGPSVDQRDRALNLMRSLSLLDFTTPGLVFHFMVARKDRVLRDYRLQRRSTSRNRAVMS